MFEKNKKNNLETQSKSNRIVEGTTLNGDIETSSDIKIDGKLTGNISTKGKVTIGLTGVIKGNIVCNSCEIEGKYEGKINVSEMLNIKQKSVIIGEVTCAKLAVEPGAEFNATCVMKPNVKNLIHNEQQSEKTA